MRPSKPSKFKAHGNDDIWIRALEICDWEVTDTFSIVFENCTHSEVIPEVIPKGDILCLKNCYLVSLLPIFVEPFASIILSSLFEFLKWIIYLRLIHQGCENQVLSVKHSIYLDFDRNRLFKSFWQKWHEYFLDKLKNLGISGNWYYAIVFLSTDFREQYLKVSVLFELLSWQESCKVESLIGLLCWQESYKVENLSHYCSWYVLMISYRTLHQLLNFPMVLPYSPQFLTQTIQQLFKNFLEFKTFKNFWLGIQKGTLTYLSKLKEWSFIQNIQNQPPHSVLQWSTSFSNFIPKSSWGLSLPRWKIRSSLS